jgi:hypothetical protein
MQPKSANSAFDPLKPPQEAAEPEMPQSVEFEASIETTSFEVSSAMISDPLKPPQ